MLNIRTKKISIIIVIACTFILYNFSFNSSILAQDTSVSKENTSVEPSKEVVPEVKKEDPSAEPEKVKEVKEDTSSNKKDKDVKKEQPTEEANKDVKKEQPSKEANKDVKKEEPKAQKPAIIQPSEEVQLSKKDIAQLPSDNILINLNLGVATNIKISSDSLLKSEVSGISLFVKVKNFTQDLALFIDSRYSSTITYTESSKSKFNAKIESISVGSVAKYKLNKHISFLSGLDLGISYGTKYMFNEDNVSFTKILIGIITACDYSFSFNPNFHMGLNFNFNIGGASSIQSLLYVGLSF